MYKHGQKHPGVKHAYYRFIHMWDKRVILVLLLQWDKMAGFTLFIGVGKVW